MVDGDGMRTCGGQGEMATGQMQMPQQGPAGGSMAMCPMMAVMQNMMRMGGAQPRAALAQGGGAGMGTKPRAGATPAGAPAGESRPSRWGTRG